MASYDAIRPSPSPYSDPQYNESVGFINPAKPKKGTSKWIKIGIPLIIILIAAAVVGGIFGSRSSKKSSSAAAASSAASAKSQIGRFPTATNSLYMVPLYPSTTNAAFTTPTFVSTDDPAQAWPKEPFSPSSPQPTTVRTDRPRLIAPSYKWDALPKLIKNDPYLKYWNDTIFGNATDYLGLPPVSYFMDGPSGILDNAREVKMRIKAFAYAYRMSKDTKWVDRAWEELKGPGGITTGFGPDDDKWNSKHFLDVAEFTAAFAIAYDWLYDIWTADQKAQIMASMIKYGLNLGEIAYDDARDTKATGWWRKNTTGNWNCVCNSGLTMGALAILGDDKSGIASRLLALTIDNAKQNCAMAPSSDGTWAETANYWYFGTTGHAEMSSSLLTATGSHYGLADVNPSAPLSGTFHMYVYGATDLFAYGDHGPNKFSTTANSMQFYAKQYNKPEFSLFQRDRADAAEPFGLFWYEPSVSGAFWNTLQLDHVFDDPLDQWVSMRSSWTDINALYVAMKAGKNQGHQTHNDLDAGDFVLDAMGHRWAGEYGSGDYRATGYFSSDAQDAQRWLYYRKRTEGQNTIVVGRQNQNALAAPSVLKSDSSKTAQGSSTVFNPPSDSTSFWVADLTTAYSNVTSFKRGVRMLDGRKRVLVQDEITAQAPIEWRMQTNATVTLSGSTATLKIDDKTMTLSILNTPDAKFTRTDATRYSSDPATPADSPDQQNVGASVVVIGLPAGTFNLQVLFTPQWDGVSEGSFKAPPSVPLDSWSLTSHK